MSELEKKAKTLNELIREKAKVWNSGNHHKADDIMGQVKLVPLDEALPYEQAVTEANKIIDNLTYCASTHEIQKRLREALGKKPSKRPLWPF
jgi:hypothetical protein